PMDVLEVVVRPLPTAGERPRTPLVPAQRAVAVRGPGPVDPVLADDAEAAAVLAGAAARADVQLVALDEHREPCLDDLDREVVRVAVGRRDQRALAVPERAPAPASDVRLREHEELVRLGVPSDHVRAAEARVRAGA